MNIIKRKNGKKKNPAIGILLLLISICLMLITGPIGLIFGMLYRFYKNTFNGIGEYSLKIAISIDQLGNVLMQDLFNILFIKKGGYTFGNRDETISSVLGKNIERQKLSKTGRFLNGILNIIEMGHSLNSIDYHIEPEK